MLIKTNAQRDGQPAMMVIEVHGEYANYNDSRSMYSKLHNLLMRSRIKCSLNVLIVVDDPNVITAFDSDITGYDELIWVGEMSPAEAEAYAAELHPGIKAADLKHFMDTIGTNPRHLTNFCHALKQGVSADEHIKRTQEGIRAQLSLVQSHPIVIALKKSPDGVKREHFNRVTYNGARLFVPTEALTADSLLANVVCYNNSTNSYHLHSHGQKTVLTSMP